MTRFTPIARTTVLLAIASSFLALTPPAFAAGDNDQLPQAQLNVAGTDFTSAKAVDHLKNRVRRTAFEICVPGGNALTPIAPDERKCYETAISNGMAQIESRQQQALRASSVNVAAAQPETHPVR